MHTQIKMTIGSRISWSVQLNFYNLSPLQRQLCIALEQNLWMRVVGTLGFLRKF